MVVKWSPTVSGNICGSWLGKKSVARLRAGPKVKQHAPSRLFRAVSHLFRFISFWSFKNVEHQVGYSQLLHCTMNSNVDMLVSGTLMLPFYWSEMPCSLLSSYSLSKSVFLWLPRLISTTVNQYVSNEHLSHFLDSVTGHIKRLRRMLEVRKTTEGPRYQRRPPAQVWLELQGIWVVFQIQLLLYNSLFKNNNNNNNVIKSL